MRKVIISQIVAVLVLAAIIVCLLWRSEPADVPLSDIESELAFSSSGYQLEKAGAMRLKRAYGINAADYKEVLYYIPSNTMSVDEMLIVKLADSSQQASVLAAIESRLEVQKKAFDGYGTNQFDILKGAVVYTTGDYVCLFVSEDAGKWRDTVKSVLKE